jgi:hypothetical protein
MPLPTNTQTTYATIGNREDLADIIYRIAPTETPFVSAVEKVKATNVNHEWQTQDLAAAGANAVLEGDDATTDAATPTVRLSNLAQISDKVARVTGTQQAVKAAGRGNELDYQEGLKAMELRRDLEFILLQNTAKNAGNATTARTTASVLSWVKQNNSSGASGSAPTAALGSNTRTDGTQRAFTENLLKGVLSSAWTEGGKPNMLMLGAYNKQVASMFSGRASATEDTSSKKIVAAVGVYESDFGTLKIVPNRFMRARDALVLETEKWAIAYLRNMATIDLAKTGDSDQRQIICEYALESRNERASGIVADLTTQ